jgi:hypothetical protein
MKGILLGLLLLASCSTPGGDIVPQQTDFAFIEVLLKG